MPPQYSMWYPRENPSCRSSLPHQGVYRCIPPTPSSLYRFRSINSGTRQTIPDPVESWMYRPTWLLELARPLGCADDLELSRIRAELAALAAKITTFPLISYSFKSSLLIYDTPVARPFSSVFTCRTMAFR